MHTGAGGAGAAGQAAAAPVYGDHLTILNSGYPPAWDPHIAGTVFTLAAVSPVYNQVVEFNPLNPKEIIGDLAKSREVMDGGEAYIFQLHDNVKWWDGKDNSKPGRSRLAAGWCGTWTLPGAATWRWPVAA